MATEISPYSALYPEEFIDVDPERLEESIKAQLPVQPIDPPLDPTLQDPSTLKVGDLLLVVAKIGRLFHHGITIRSTGSKITNVGLVIETNPLTVLGVTDLDRRFFYYPEYAKPLRIIHPFADWVAAFHNHVYVRKNVCNPSPSALEQLKEEYANLDYTKVSFFMDAIIIARLFELLNLPLPFASGLAVPGHFGSVLPSFNNEPLYRIYEYVRPPRTEAEQIMIRREVLQDFIYIKWDELRAIGVKQAFAFSEDRMVAWVSDLTDETRPSIQAKIEEIMAYPGLKFQVELDGF